MWDCDVRVASDQGEPSMAEVSSKWSEVLVTTYYPLHTTYHLLSTTTYYLPPPTTYHLPPPTSTTSYYFQLPTSDFLLTTHYFPLPPSAP